MNKSIVPKTTYRPSSVRILHHLSDGQTTAPHVGQRFLGRGAPLSSFHNRVIDDLQVDVFWKMYMLDMPYRDDIPEGRELNRSLLAFLEGDPNWPQLANQFSGQKLVSAAIAHEMTQRLLDMVDGAKAAIVAMDAAEELEQQAEAQEKRQRDSGEGDDELPWDTSQDDDDGDTDTDGEDGDGENEDGEDENGDSDGDQGDPDEMREQAEQFREQSRRAQKRAEQSMQRQNASMTRSAIVADAEQIGGTMSAFMRTWGIEDGDVVTLNINDVSQLMSMLGDSAFAQLSFLIGRIYNIGMKVLTGRSSVDLVEDDPGFTDELTDIDLLDLARLSPVLGEDVQMYNLRKFYEDGGAWGTTRSARAKNKGTFLAAIDESMSMEEPLGVDEPTSRAIFSKALTLGLMQSAVLSGQEFYAIGFSSQIQQTDLVTNRSSVSERMKFGLHHFNGGTNFNVPLSLLLDLFDGLSETDKEGSDILFVTDGECTVSQDVVERLFMAKEHYGLRLILLVIGNDAAYGEAGDIDNIETHADIVLSFRSIDETAMTIAQALWDSR